MLIQKETYQILAKEDRIEVRIIGEGKYHTVERLETEDIEVVRGIARALENYFNNPHIPNYRREALEGKINPLETWNQIKEFYSLTAK